MEDIFGGSFDASVIASDARSDDDNLVVLAVVVLLLLANCCEEGRGWIPAAL